MPLEHDAPRFTIDQRDAILNLAARLQVQHEATVGADELVREAEAAGIDARFVYEATVRLGQSQSPSSLRGPIFAFSLFILQTTYAMYRQYVWAMRGSDLMQAPDYAVLFALAFALAFWAAREGKVRRFVPIAPLVVWSAVGGAASGLTRAYFHPPFWILCTVLVGGLVQTAAALLAMATRNAAERSLGSVSPGTVTALSKAPPLLLRLCEKPRRTPQIVKAESRNG